MQSGGLLRPSVVPGWFLAMGTQMDIPFLYVAYYGIGILCDYYFWYDIGIHTYIFVALV